MTHTYQDNDISAFNGADRPGFNSLKEAIVRGEVEAVIVQHLERIARSVTTFRDFIDLCVSHDVRLEAWSGPVDTSSAAGRFTSTVEAATAEHYSAVISEKARAAHADIAQRGEPNGGRRPFGYQRTTFTDEEGKERRTFTPDPDEAPVVAEVFDRCARGESIRSLAIDLDSRGFTTSGGARWSTARMRDVLGNPLYLGLRVWKDQVIPGNWPPLVERELFETVQAMLSGRRKPPGHNVRKYFLAGGLARCGVCGRPLVSKPTKKIRRYACKAVADGGCGKISVVADDLEAHMSEVIVKLLSRPHMLEAVARRQDSGNAEILAEIDRLEARRVALAEMFAVGTIDRQQLEVGTARLDRERKALRDKLTDLPPTIDVEQIKEIWGSGRVEDKARVAASMFDRVIVDPALVRGRGYFDPERVRIVAHHPSTR